MGHLKSAAMIFTVIFLCFFITVSGEEAEEGEQSSHLSLQRAALLDFKSGVVSDPSGLLRSWRVSSPIHVCNWTGVKCSSSSNGGSRQIVEIDLSGMSLHGTISPSLSNVSSLAVLDLSRNFFRGRIPKEFGRIARLKQLSLSSNLLEGRIPEELGLLRELVYLDLGANKLFDEIPEPLFCNASTSGFSQLEYVDLSNNSLSGEIPINCELPKLRFLLLWSNKLVGNVPPLLSKSGDLEWLDLESNILSGELPLEIVSKMPKLQFLYLSYNRFVSHDGNANLEPFLSALLVSSNLEELELAGNSLGGEIPPIIGNLSKNLVQIHLDQNLLSGSIPPQVGNLVNLTLLNLSSNLLDGTIPFELCRMVRLERIYLSDNSLSGEIPECFGDVSHLGLLDLSKNRLSGSIPDSFANLPQLRKLLLYDNNLSGTIPRSLGECMNLEILDLSRNEISGTIPGEVAGLSSLKLYLNLSSNRLDGELPLELSEMDMVLAIDLSSNNLSSTIPSQLGSCIALEYLNLSGNSFRGPIPDTIGTLPYLKALDVSSNQLSGSIPETLQTSSNLKQLNFSFNMFSGNVSNQGAFSTLTMQSFLGNHGLCGSIQGMHSCKNKHSSNSITLSLVVSLFAVLSLCIFVYRSVSKSRVKSKFGMFDQEELDDDDEEKGQKNDLKYPKISYRQLIQATGGLCPSTLIGSGRFGKVYKGVLQDNTRIAVKVLDPKTAGEMLEGSFKRECQVLRRTRHRNLIRIITTCSRPNFKALVFPLMSNGSLERHLYPSHGSKPGLNLVQLISICHDVAEGLAYLHHYSPVRVVHCDPKPSNILLDDDFTALVTDFGIAKLVNGADELKNWADDSVSFESTNGLLCGSFGYIAPEYGMGKGASTQGDVYSYGVLLLEIITGRMPTDVLFHEGSNLHEWVKSHYPHRLEPIVENAILRYVAMNSLPENLSTVWKDAVLELIDLGLMCSQYNPSTRPTMLDVAHEMGKLKDYVTSPHSLLIQGTDPKPGVQ